MTNYDPIASAYQQCKQQPWRVHVEQFTMLDILGDLTGRSVLELACGEGFYSRIVKRHGAAQLLAIDSSAGMIELARRQETAVPLGIDYRVADAQHLDLGQKFDLVLAAYLLNHASSREELLAMCQTAARHLKPGGRFVGVNNNPVEPPEHFLALRKYGFTKSTSGERREGSPITITVLLDEGPFEMTDYYLTMETHEWAMRQAGFCRTRWLPSRVAPAGVAEFGQDYWTDFLSPSPIMFFDCERG